MTSNRLKNLARLRLILSVIAVLLAGVMAFSGVMYFGSPVPAPTGEAPAESVAPSAETLTPEPTETTEITEATEIVESAETTEATNSESTEAVDETESDSSKTEEPIELEPGSKPGWFPIGPAGSSGSEVTTDATTAPDDDGITPANPDNHDGHDHEEGISVGSLSETYSDEITTTPSENNITDTATTEPVEITSETEISKAGMNISTTSEEEPFPLWMVLFWSSGAFLILDIIVIAVISSQIKQEKKRLQRVRKSLSQTDEYARRPMKQGTPVQPFETTQLLDHGCQIGTLHQVGRREYQQDSLGHTSVLDSNGILAVLADGMGGLSGGEKVSQKIVMDALEMGRQLKPEQTNGILWKMVDVINNNVNQMLGPDGLYKSGSTLLAVLVYNGKFQWIAVGDSRIYLYRQGYANQLNHDHDQLQVWMADVLSGRRTMEDMLRNPEGKKLTSFIGMGQLKYIDGSRGAISLEPGDRLVLMSDGVYNVVNETALAGVLKRYPDVDQATSVIDRMIRENNHPHQDNYTAIVLGF